MIAVIFELEPAPGQQAAYLDHAAALRAELEAMPGFISVERFESLSTPGKRCRCRSSLMPRRWRRGGIGPRIGQRRRRGAVGSSPGTGCVWRRCCATMG